MEGKFLSKEAPVARIAPNRKWFGPTRMMAQAQLTAFQDAIKKSKQDSYSVLLNKNRLPLSLINEATSNLRFHILDTEKFGSTFGPGSQRKKPKIDVDSMEEMMKNIGDKLEEYTTSKEELAPLTLNDDSRSEVREAIFSKGQSKRIYNELYKVLIFDAKIRLSILQTLLFTFSMLAIPKVHDAAMLKSTSKMKRNTSIWCSF